MHLGLGSKIAHRRDRRRLAGVNESAEAPSRCLTEVASGSYLFEMRSVGLKVLKNKLSEYVRIAEQGETVLIADRDRVVAELGPVQATRSPVLADAMLSEAIRRGHLTPALRSPAPPPRAAAVAKLRDLLGELDDDRSDR